MVNVNNLENTENIVYFLKQKYQANCVMSIYQSIDSSSQAFSRGLTFLNVLLSQYHRSQEMIEGGITSRMSGIIENAGHHPSPQDYR